MKNIYDSMLKIPNLSVYYKENVPEDYHYSKSDRIGLFKSHFFHILLFVINICK